MLIDDQTIVYSTWYKQSLVDVNDFYNDNVLIYSMQELHDIYGIETNFLTEKLQPLIYLNIC